MNEKLCDFLSRYKEVIDIIKLLSSSKALYILMKLNEENIQRFTQLQQEVYKSPAVMSYRLKQLLDLGLIEAVLVKDDETSFPKKVYTLTRKGKILVSSFCEYVEKLADLLGKDTK